MVILIVHIGRLFKHQINIIFIILLSRMGMPHPKELTNDITSYPKETITLNVNFFYPHILLFSGPKVFPFSLYALPVSGIQFAHFWLNILDIFKYLLPHIEWILVICFLLSIWTFSVNLALFCQILAPNTFVVFILGIQFSILNELTFQVTWLQMTRHPLHLYIGVTA